MCLYIKAVGIRLGIPSRSTFRHQLVSPREYSLKADIIESEIVLGISLGL